MPPSAVQIVSIGSSDDDYSFTLDEQAMMGVLSKAPPQMKVAVVSCVGAFRTGKSALLSWFLRYLRLTSLHDEDWEDVAEALDESGEEGEKGEGGGGGKWWTKGGKLNEGEKFDWRGGQERHTTGIWMWSEPFIRLGANGTKLAVYVVDTQGLFDNETTQSLTASIFGLSTLLSSHSIYNVSGRIGEDALQHLALFAEYGRVALKAEEEEGEDEDEEEEDSRKKKRSKSPLGTPFQKIEFLVRDWQNFTIDEPSSEDDFTSMESEMNNYLMEVIRSRDASDLAETRQQISECFEKVSAYLLPHPGIPVTRKNFDGDPSKVDPTFLALLDRYVRRVFSAELSPKTIHGRTLTSSQLGSYIKAYASIFAGGSEFPEPTTLLKATASANNVNAKMVAVGKYKTEMDAAFGPGSSVFAKAEEFEQHHVACSTAALEMFDNMANFGSSGPIATVRAEALDAIKESKRVYKSLNESRNPLAGFETYVLPVVVGVASWVLRTITDLTCSSWSQTCKASSDMLGQVTTVIVVFMVIIGATKAKIIGEKIKQLKTAFEVVGGPGN
ncbi:hypothetical protein TrCOL_g2096 [Triparma columacea]|uniref:GB1/RHD3-type G domain-containing protein n=1 Tax=Triparma columacea TaxID=722753 RepID=A0A9W7G965_9STRA|nr:hypothetical protein TrCOL_g2096 [Triparma columacea]